MKGCRTLTAKLAVAAAISPIGLVATVEPIAAQRWENTAELIGSDTVAGDNFAWAVAIDGDTIVVGARWDDDLGNASGSAYVFEYDGVSDWVETAKLLASDGSADARFGESVAIDGDTILVGAIRQGANGATYIFERDGAGDWVEAAKLTTSGGDAFQFGFSVSISGDTAVVGQGGGKDPSINAAYIFERGELGGWVERKLTPAGATLRFGEAVDVDGDTVVVGASDDLVGGVSSGAAYVFEPDGFGNWVQTVKLKGSDAAAYDSVGAAVAVSGDSMALGAPNSDPSFLSDGSVYAFALDAGGMWVETARLTPSGGGILDDFGDAVTVDGDTLLVAERSGDSVYFFGRDGTRGWKESLSSQDGVPASVAVSGETAVVGGWGFTNRGSVWVFKPLRDLDLDVSGNCPGEITLELTGASPHGDAKLLGSPATGLATLPEGPCAGTEVGLDGPRLLTAVQTDLKGNYSIDVTVDEAEACGGFVQAMDAETCGVSDVVQLPGSSAPAAGRAPIAERHLFKP